MKNIFLTLLVILFCFSCSKSDRSSSRTVSILRNFSQQQITVVAYKNGAALAQENYVLAPEIEKVVSQSEGRGKNTLAVYPQIIANNDSIVVSFGATVRVVHYPFNATANNAKAIRYGNPRNLFTLANYTRSVIIDTRNSFEDHFIYTFTTQDYVDALK